MLVIPLIIVFLIGLFLGIKSNAYRKETIYIPEGDPDYEAFNALMYRVYENNLVKGWRKEGDEQDLKFGDYIANLHSEISELWEAYRNRKLFSPCDKSEEMSEKFGEILSCAEEELADTIIRAVDTAHAMGITNIGKAIRIKHLYNTTRSYKHGNKAA